MLDKFQNKYRIPSARLKNWDYGSDAIYFVTICTANRECYFGEIVETQNLASPYQMEYSELGKIANQCWIEIPKHFPFVILDKFVVMPNHVHGIIIIDKPMKKYGDGNVGRNGGRNGERNGWTQSYRRKILRLYRYRATTINSGHNQKIWHRLFGVLKLGLQNMPVQIILNLPGNPVFTTILSETTNRFNEFQII